MRYPTYLTDCQWNANHLHSVLALEFLSESDFCSVDVSGVINGWSIEPQSLDALILEDANRMDLGCRDAESIKISQQFTFDVSQNVHLKATHFMHSAHCISVNRMNENLILFAHKSSVYLLERMASNVEIVKEYSLKYNIAGIAHSCNESIVCVAFCPWKSDEFVAGFDNGMIWYSISFILLLFVCAK